MQQRFVLLVAVPLIAWSCAHSLDSSDTSPDDGTTATGSGAGPTASAGVTVAASGTGGMSSGTTGGGGMGGMSGTGGTVTSTTSGMGGTSSTSATTTSTTASTSTTSNTSTASTTSSTSSTTAASSTTSGSGGGPTGMEVEYKVGMTGNGGTAIGSELWVVNNGNTAVDLTGMTLRYYLTTTGEVVLADFKPTINWSYVVPIVGGSQVTYSTITITPTALVPSVATADCYLQFAFSGGMVPPAYAVHFSWQVTNNDSKDFNQSNDYSYNGGDASETSWMNIVLLQGGTVLWGAEP